MKGETCVWEGNMDFLRCSYAIYNYTYMCIIRENLIFLQTQSEKTKYLYNGKEETGYNSGKRYYRIGRC